MRGEGIVPVMEVGNNGSNGNNGNYGNGMFGNEWAWIVIIFLIFGFGRNGFGGYGNDGGGSNSIPFYQSLDTDFATIERKLDTISNGICDSTFALNNTVVNSTNALQNSLNQGFAGLNTGLITQGYETRLGINGLSSQLASCCCDIREGISSVNYNMAMNTNNITNAMCLNTRDIIDNQNANYRALHDEIVANRIEDKNAQITAQQNEINALRLSASQAKQNAYLLNELKPCPSAAYIVPNPNCCYQYQVTQNTCGCNNGCY